MAGILDSRLSNSFGIDNDLCLPHRSFSFWSLVIVAIVDFAEIYHHYTSSRLTLYLTLSLFVVAAMISLYQARVKIHGLSVSQGAAPLSVQLRSLSRLVNVLSGAVLWACFSVMYLS